MEPLHIQFELVRKGREDGINEEVYLEPFVDEKDSKKKPPPTEYISELASISWGLDHCVFVDKKHRVFSMGYNRYGRLGHGEEKDRIKPTMIKELKKEKIIHVHSGHFHSLAINKEG